MTFKMRAFHLFVPMLLFTFTHGAAATELHSKDITNNVELMHKTNRYSPDKGSKKVNEISVSELMESEYLYLADDKALLRSKRQTDVEGSGGDPGDGTGSGAGRTKDLYDLCLISEEIKGDDESSTVVNVEVGLPYGDKKYHKIYIGSNGVISLGDAFNSYEPRFGVEVDFVAPYWSDIAVNKGGRLTYCLLNKDEFGFQRHLELFSEDIQTYGGNANFSATWAVLVTYEGAASYGGNDNETVTFQVVLASDGFETYTIFLYKDMNWTEGNGKGTVFIGYNQAGVFKRILYSGTPAAFDIDEYVGNTGIRGFWIFKVGETPNAERQCLDWYKRKVRDRTTQIRLSNLELCGPTRRSMRFNNRFRWFRRKGTSACFLQRRRSRFLPVMECCYSTFGNIVESGRDAGGQWIHNPRVPSLRKKHYEEDFVPREVCCIKSNKYCHLYRRLRFFRFLARLFRRIRRAAGIGDPHISTIDGMAYVFNGLGEYTLVRTDTFVLQGRTDRVETVNGTLTNATIFSAIAFKEKDGASFQVELNNNKSGLIIYGQGRDFTSSFYGDDHFQYDSEDGLLSLSRNGNEVKAVFETGISIIVSAGIKLLRFSLEIHDDLANKTQGLLGNFNGVANDDFTLPNGTALSANITEKQIFHDFGQAWHINASESVFQYPARKGPEDFTYPNFKPIFLEDQTDEALNRAASVCNGSTNLACIYDFISTGNRGLALETKVTNEQNLELDAEIENTQPEINGTKLLNAKIGEASVIHVSGTDAEDGDGVMYFVNGEPHTNFVFDNQSKQATWTPANIDPVKIMFYVEDSKQSQSERLKVEVRLCDGCSGNGECDYTRTRENPSEPYDPSFQLVACTCNTGWTGDNCSEDFDGCLRGPCYVRQNCTDMPASTHASTGTDHECSTCNTPGYNSTTCQDIDECNDPNVCDQSCENTDGSFICTCEDGYRLFNVRTCKDINECDERVSGCEQICNNTEGSFNCACRSGYILNNDGKSCSPDGSNTCSSTLPSCDHGCTTDHSGNAACFCNNGFSLKSDNTSCENENECSITPNPCSQICRDNDGSFVCSCRPGFSLASDKRSCEVCSEFTYGDECSKTCQCGEHGTECDDVRGCICESGWKGEDCTTDIDECADQTHNCTVDTVCINTGGSYRCDCRYGYSKQNDTCQDIDECNDPALNDCEHICQNSAGSFSCSCPVGYKTNSTSSSECVDIDECEAGINQCEQFCDNVEGSYNCRCEFGFRLTANRKNCKKVEDVCAAFSNLTCSYACNISTDEQTANCYCQQGYKLADDDQTCLDIDECEVNSTNACSHNCSNEVGSYLCSCPVGAKLENDERTCTDCDDNHWGEKCVNECNCGIGSSRCDKITGCKCKSGWSGTQCDQDIDECSTAGICPSSSVCRNTPGDYTCICNAGYILEGDACVDVNECLDEELNVCVICNNTIGSFTCSCHPGFVFKDGKCQDIDECKTSKDNCEHICRNTLGSYSCECRSGFTFLPADFSKCTTDGFTSCSRTDCELCEKMNNGTEMCFCKRGFKLNNDQTCSDIDECEAEPCNNGTCTQSVSVPGDFSCSCSTGYQLAADKVTCTECREGTFGEDCKGTCDCENINTESCSTTDGKCTCRSGWTGSRCDEDIDECKLPSPPSCTLHSTCVNTNGSHVCVCETGFTKRNGLCSRCGAGEYGENCEESCSCIMDNVESCDNVNGKCNCKKEWKGSKCSVDVNECENTTVCTSYPNTKCVNIDGGFKCECQNGYHPINGSCEDINECSGSPCPSDEICINNNGNYTCECQPNFSRKRGKCTDINECNNQNGGCEHICNNNVGSFNCSCRDGFILNNDNRTCTDVYTVSLVLIVEDPNNQSQLLVDPVQYNRQRNLVRKSLWKFYEPKIESLQDIIVERLSEGSLRVNYDLVVNLTSTNKHNSSIEITAAIISLNNAGQFVLNGTGQMILNHTLKDTQDSSMTTCELFNRLDGCNDDSECISQNGKPECKKKVSKNEMDRSVVIGLSVGVPLAAFSILLLAILICIKRKSKEGIRMEKMTNNSSNRNHENPFVASIPKRNTHSARNYMQYIPDGLSVTSSSDSWGKHGKRNGRNDFHDSAWYDNQTHDTHDELLTKPQSNFSWDFMYKILPSSKFEINRPKVSGTP